MNVMREATPKESRAVPLDDLDYGEPFVFNSSIIYNRSPEDFPYMKVQRPDGSVHHGMYYYVNLRTGATYTQPIGNTTVVYRVGGTFNYNVIK